MQLLEVCERPGKEGDAQIPADVLHPHDAAPHCKGVALAWSQNSSLLCNSRQGLHDQSLVDTSNNIKSAEPHGLTQIEVTIVHCR